MLSDAYLDLLSADPRVRSVGLSQSPGRLTQQDLGQMLLYTGYYQAEEMREGENPPIGLILCADRNEAAVRYALSDSARQIFTSRYQLHLPTEQELVEELRRERELLESQKIGDE